MRKRTLAMALAPLALLAAACGGDDGDSGESSTAASVAGAGSAGDCTLDTPLKIGFAADLGELGAFSDQPGSEAAKLQVDLLNKAGGVGGKPIEYTVKDIQGDPAATQRAAQELLDDGVNALIGPPFTNTGTPLLDTVNGKAPIIFMASTDPQLADPARGGFLASFSDPVQAAATAEFAFKKGKKNAVTFSSAEDVYFSGNPAYFADAFEKAGGTVVRDLSFSLADEDFSTQVNEMAKLTPKPDVVFTPMVMPAIGTLLQQMKAAGLGEVTVMGPDSFDATVVWSAGEVAEGVFFAGHTFPSADNKVQALLDAAADAGLEIETISFGALAADAVQVLAHAAETACSVDGKKLIETIDAITELEVTTGKVTYAGTGGVPEKDVAILTVTDGEPALETTMRPSYIPS